MRMVPILLFLVLLSVFPACNNSEVVDIMEVDPDNIYFDYKISGDEADPGITVLLHFRLEGPNGNALLLKTPSMVELDGKPLRADSSKMTGAFYEAILPVNEFIGKHIITFTAINKKEYREEFQFRPLQLKSALPPALSRKGFDLELEGVEEGELIRVILTDTSFTSDGINRRDTVRNGRISISKEELEYLHSGPVHLEIYREYERPVKDATAEGGKLAITYVLRRGIFLTD